MIVCAHEQDVLEAIALDRIEQVRGHLGGCPSCADIVSVADALRREHVAACREAQVPPAGAVWWRATVRARAEAARTVSQPITVAQSVAGACTVGLACALIGIVWRGLSWGGGFGDLLARVASRRDEVAPALTLLVQHAVPLTLTLAACLVIAPVALYLALSDE